MGDKPDPPFSMEGEKAALGCMFLDAQAAVSGCGLLVEKDFYYPIHRDIFEAFCAAVKEHGGADVALVWRKLEEKGQAEKIGLSYLADISCTVATSIRLREYCKELRRLSYYRRCIENGRKIVEAAYKQERGTLDKAFAAMKEDGVADEETFLTAADILEKYIRRLDEKRQRGELFSGITTGFLDLDLLLGGLREDDLVILAGRPAMGKTSLGLDFLRRGAKDLALQGKVAILFSLEMGAEDVAGRIYSAETGTDNVLFSIRENDDGKWAALLRSIETDGEGFETMAQNILIDDNARLGLEDMRGKCHAIRAKGREVGLIVLDYLQLMGGGNEQNRVQEISTISRGLKLLAREFHCPVVALSQLSREVEKRPNKRPMLSDLRDSGSIEQDADVVLFVYRDEYYNADTEKKNIAEVIVAKQRNGPIGTVDLRWIPQSTTFRNLQKEPKTEGWRSTKKKGPWDEQ